DLTVERPHECDPIREAAADECSERASRQRPGLVGEKGALRDLSARREPDSREVVPGPEWTRRDDPSACRHEPGLRAAPEDGDRQLRQDSDAEGVREGAVDDRATNGC